MFANARLRLTLWYLGILAIIVGLLSLVLYRILVSLQETELAGLGPTVRHGVARLFARDEGTLAVQIVALDAGILILAALGAYVLAGRTLAPIQKAMERQERFAAAASHELRTPLTVLQGSMEVGLLTRRAPEEYEDILRRAAEEAARMGVLVGDLLTLARAQHDAEAVNLELLNLRDTVREALASVGPLVERKSLGLESHLDGPLLVVGDPLKLRQVLSNLLDNAVTYTQDGGAIVVDGRREHGKVRIEVRDSGPGIASEHLPHLFEPFYRVDRARGGESAHSGLGLSLAAWIARAHHGQLTVESEAGLGSTFILTLPAVRS